MLYNIKVFGIVQGVGFRPFIDRLANTFHLNGSVANRGSYVEIFVQGGEGTVKAFVNAIKNESPPRAIIIDITIDIITTAKTFADFRIIDSERESGNIFVSPDIAICDKCRAELFDKNNRRYLHPFINCTDCGPRLTIMQKMPYDRERTSMSAFPMCDDCREEYYNPTSRRYDAQPVCCNACGPEVYILDGEECGGEAITKVRKIIKNGGIAAIKGIGGFHLACDATNIEAVQRLRERKYRPQKPFAVMINFLKVCPSTHIVNGHQKPIVLLPKDAVCKVAENVAPNNHKLGVMLPYTPLHLLIFDYPDNVADFPEVLVMTSGNISGTPLATNDEEARRDLSTIADVILTHNRDILIRSDDTVMDIVDGKPYMIRRSRGYAPLPIHFSAAKSISVLAVGGELKNTFCLSKGDLFYMSPYIGDLTDLRTVEALKSSVKRMIDLLEINPDVIACDLHPRYHSTQIAEELAAEMGIHVLKVQHHYAHILSCMAENDFSDPVIGVAFDGTGYGTDGTVWGGEFMIVDAQGFRRVDSITPFIQAGGDKSSVEGWRNAVSMIFDIVGDVEETKKIAARLNLADERKYGGHLYMIQNNFNCVTSTSAGRLFDAVSAILGICSHATFEGEAAMKLQYYAECGISSTELRANFSTKEIFASLLERRLHGEDVHRLAFDFHSALAGYIVDTCQKIRERQKISTVALSGGVFQNTLLLTLTLDRLKAAGFEILHHKKIPPNDGGIALGQGLAVHFS